MAKSTTLDQMQILVAVEETGSFSAAARKLGRVQSAISQAIQALEMAYAIDIFDRSGYRPRLTDAGRALVTQAQQVLRQAERFERTASAITAGVEPELTLAVDTMLPSHPIIRALDELRQQFPDLGVTLYSEALLGTERRVQNGSALLGICPLQPTAAPNFQAYPLTHIELVPVVAPFHPLAREEGPLDREQLAQHVQLILTDPLSTSGRSHSIVSSRLWRFIEGGWRLECLLAGFGWGNAPSHLVAHHIASGALKRLPVNDPAIAPVSIPIHAIRNRNNVLGEAAKWLLQNLQRQEWHDMA